MKSCRILKKPMIVRGTTDMNNVYGMSLQQFYDVLEEMRTIYPFEADKTYLGNLRDLPSDSMKNVEILTTDANTGIQIILSKAITGKVDY